MSLGARARRQVLVAAATSAIVALALAAYATAPAHAETQTLGLEGWRVQSSALAAQNGRQISAPGFDAGSWLAVTPDDAGAPGTEIAALLQNSECPNVFYSEEMRRCFGYMSRIGRDTLARFAVPWWWRTDFTAALTPGQRAELVISGVVGAASVWLNGHAVARRRTVQGAYARYAFDVTSLLRPGVNSLALELAPNDPLKMLTLDDVDWNQIPPDNDTGIQFPIQLHIAGPPALSDVHVLQQDTPTVSAATLTLKGQLANTTSEAVTGEVSAVLTPPSGAPVTLERAVTLGPEQQAPVTFSAAEFPRLQLEHPAVWWPYQMGAQPMYRLTMTASPARTPGDESIASSAPAKGEPPENDGTADSQSVSFGIRTVGSELVGPSPQAPAGVRRFSINGRPFVLRGGGWAEDEFLRYSSANTAAQIGLIKNLGLNAIRTEGKQMPQDFYEQMDRAGIMIDAGFQCCDAWQPERQRKPSAREYHVMELSARTIGEELRDHPSVLNYSWSDNAPTPEQEKVSLRGFAEAEFQDPLIASAEYNSGRVLGPSGEKEGPYDWVPPSYWYDQTHYDPHDPTRTNVGGAWGFDSEASAGDTVPTLDSIDRFMAPFEQEALWREPAFNQYHTNYEPEIPGPGNEGYSFGTLYNLDRAIAKRYGPPESLAQYVQEAQAQNYETQRAEFEAYIDHADAQPTPSTGIVYWMLNKAMPSLLWDLYNQEFDEAGSYFGAKEANRPVHALLAYDTHTVSLDNLTGSPQTGLSVHARVYSLDGRLLDERSASELDLEPQQVLQNVLNPALPADTHPPEPAQTYFVQLLVQQGGRTIDRNVYWLSTQQDEIDWPKTVGSTFATLSRYADLRGLRGLPAATLSVSGGSHSEPGPDGADTATTVTIENVSPTPTVAFLVRADIRRGRLDGTPEPGDNEVLPVFWSEDDIALWPGETATLTAAYSSSALEGAAQVVSVSGWNTKTLDVPAPMP
jgi:exo-1,4-beta-D-glucosaminidase